MKKGRDISELFTEISRQQATKQDFIAPTDQLKVSVKTPTTGTVSLEDIKHNENLSLAPKDYLKSTINLDIENQGSFPIQDTAHGQLATFAKIPRQYYRRMQEEQPQLLADNVNTWLKATPARRMVRTMDGMHRAFLSDRFRVLDHLDIVKTMLPVLSDVGLQNTDVVSCEITEKRLYFKALFPKIQEEVKKGDVVQAGVVISNSEIGLGSVNVQPLIMRLVCVNGMIRNDFGMKKYHVGRLAGEGRDAYRFFKDDTLKADDEAFMKKMRDVIIAAANEAQFKLLVDDLRETTERKVNDPLGAIQEVTKAYSLNDDDSTGVLKHFIEGGDLSQYGIAQALTRHSQDVEDYDKATDFERMGGKIIELKPTQWHTIETAKAA